MKNTLIILALLCTASCSVDAQAKFNPIDLLEGNWLFKTNTIHPEPTDIEWKTTHTIVRYEPIMERNGLKQISYSQNKEKEMYYFFDGVIEKLYGMQVDENGYMWQTEMALNDEGNSCITAGGPIHDTSLKMTNDLKIISDSELSLEHVEYKDGKEVLKVTGMFYRIPDLPLDFN